MEQIIHGIKAGRIIGSSIACLPGLVMHMLADHWHPGEKFSLQPGNHSSDVDSSDSGLACTTGLASFKGDALKRSSQLSGESKGRNSA